MRLITVLALLAFSGVAGAAERPPDAEIIRGFVNLARVNQIAFALRYRLVQYGDLEIGASLHEHAVALQLLDAEMIDPWGTPYRITIDGKSFRVRGAGSDRAFDSEDPPERTTNTAADVIHNEKEMVSNNYPWLFRQVGKRPGNIPWMYDVPVFEPVHRRHPEQLPATPDEARALDFAMEHPWVFIRFGDFDVIRAVKTRAALELWIAKLESYRAARGSLRGLTGRSLAVLLKEPWPFDEWLLSADEWGTPFRVDVGDDGQTYRVISAGADKSFDSGNVAETSPAKDLIAENGRITSGLNVAAYEKKLAAEQEERDRKLIAERAAAPVKAPDGSVAWYVGGDVLPPEAIRKVDPVYPPALREQQAEGFCIVEVVVDEEGNVAYANAVFGKNPEVSKAAVAAIRQWKFKPAMREGKPVRAIVNLTVGFRPQ